MKNQIYICCPGIQGISKVGGHLKNSSLMLKLVCTIKVRQILSEQVRFCFFTNSVNPDQTVPKAVESESHFALINSVV